MLTNTNNTPAISDSHRDAERYYRLLLALRRATSEIRELEAESQPDIEAVFARLLPDLAAALNAKQAFVAGLRVDGHKDRGWFELTATHPRQDLRGRRLKWSKLLKQLIKDGKPKVVDPLGEPTPDFIPGLEIFEATSAILARVQAAGQVCIVGTCNKANPDLGPFLAADGLALDNILELVAMGARVGEQRRRELAGIQKTSAVISAELDQNGLLPMVAQEAAEVFGAPATSLMLWDDNEENLVIRAGWGLSDEYKRQQRIPREKLYAEIKSAAEFRYFLISDLQLRSLGNMDLNKRERLHTVLSAPLVLGDQMIGILNIYSKDKPRQFTAHERELARIFATQAAIAVQNARLYESARDQVRQLQALHEAGKTIAQAGLEIEAVLQAILGQAVTVTGAYFGILQLVEGDDLKLEAAWPVGQLEGLKQQIGRMSITGKGITARAVRENQAQLVSNVTQDPDFMNVSDETGSELAVVLRRNGQPIGVLNVEHREIGVLNQKDRALLIDLANLAVVALQNAEQYEELQEVRDRGLASEAVAWLGLFGADWQHTIHQKTFSIGNYINALRSWLAEQETPPNMADMAYEALNGIEKVTESIRTVQFTGPVPSGTPGEAGGETVIDIELEKMVSRWCEDRKDVKKVFNLHCAEISVIIPPQWLRVAIEKLVNNALKAMSGGGELTVATQLEGDMVHITVKDTGEGIPNYARSQFLKSTIRRPKKYSNKEGTGKGALIARFIARTYGGDLTLVGTRPEINGTELLLTSPVVMDNLDSNE